MAGLSFSYFVTRQELREIVSELDRTTALQYAEYGNFMSEACLQARKLASLLDDPELGNARAGACRSAMFLVLPEAQPLREKRIASPDGERTIISQEFNKPSVVWSPGGHWKDAMLLQGEVMSAYRDRVTRRMLRNIRGAFAKHCKKQRGYYISPGAARLENTRFITVSEDENPGMDFHI